MLHCADFRPRCWRGRSGCSVGCATGPGHSGIAVRRDPRPVGACSPRFAGLSEEYSHREDLVTPNFRHMAYAGAISLGFVTGHPV